MIDPTKCTYPGCGKSPNDPIHSEVGGHVFRRVQAIPYQPERSYGLWIFLGATVVVAMIAFWLISREEAEETAPPVSVSVLELGT